MVFIVVVYVRRLTLLVFSTIKLSNVLCLIMSYLKGTLADQHSEELPRATGPISKLNKEKSQDMKLHSKSSISSHRGDLLLTGCLNYFEVVCGHKQCSKTVRGFPYFKIHIQ